MDQIRMTRIIKMLIKLSVGLVVINSSAEAETKALLLYDSGTHKIFAGCLNCNRHDDASICNRYGEYGSKYSDLSIWNRYGDFGSKYQDNSPWSRYGEGLIIVDSDGAFYGQFSLNKHSRYGQSKISFVQSLLKLYEADVDLDKIRDLLCEQ